MRSICSWIFVAIILGDYSGQHHRCDIDNEHSCKHNIHDGPFDVAIASSRADRYAESSQSEQREATFAICTRIQPFAYLLECPYSEIMRQVSHKIERVQNEKVECERREEKSTERRNECGDVAGFLGSKEAAYCRLRMSIATSRVADHRQGGLVGYQRDQPSLAR